ncbi:MAG TPA: hypothetical protein VGF67_28885 [Ktedonobacteraceae bacterium]|jgi:ABC-type branched-subunit amino acid transport system substrate-binding protein
MLQIAGLKNIAFAGNDGIVVPTFTQNSALVAGAGPIYATVPVLDSSQTGSGRQLFTDLTNQGKSNLRPYTATAYDCVQIVLQAISQVISRGILPPRNSWDRQARIFRQAIARAILSMSYTGGASGEYIFKSNGDSTSTSVSVYQLQNAQWIWKTLL